jgi:hypothetical protein
MLGINDINGRLDRMEKNMAAIVTALGETNEKLDKVSEQLNDLIQIQLISAGVDTGK